MDRDETGKVGKYYDALSRSYDELYSREQSLKHNLVNELLKGRRFRLALDVGCGTGVFLRSCSCYEEAVGIDLSREMLEKARQRRLKNVELVVGDACSLPIRDGQADLIVSISLAEANSTLPRMLAELERVAENQSVLALTVFNQQETILGLSSLEIESTTRLSERENLYLVRLNPDSKSEASQQLAGAL